MNDIKFKTDDEVEQECAYDKNLKVLEESMSQPRRPLNNYYLAYSPAVVRLMNDAFKFSDVSVIDVPNGKVYRRGKYVSTLKEFLESRKVD